DSSLVHVASEVLGDLPQPNKRTDCRPRIFSKMSLSVMFSGGLSRLSCNISSCK
ncbi:hypothetical protein TorRG33x02_357470, partial [Trema orientale]